jgi:hypothetical protein
MAMIAINVDPRKKLFARFFRQFPNRRLQITSDRILRQLVALNIPMGGKPGGWTGGIVYAVSSIGVGVPGILNEELEEVFKVSMSTIYKRAAQVRKFRSMCP